MIVILLNGYTVNIFCEAKRKNNKTLRYNDTITLTHYANDTIG